MRHTFFLPSFIAYASPLLRYIVSLDWKTSFMQVFLAAQAARTCDYRNYDNEEKVTRVCEIAD